MEGVHSDTDTAITISLLLNFTFLHRKTMADQLLDQARELSEGQIVRIPFPNVQIKQLTF
jgi:hypothetical protein